MVITLKAEIFLPISNNMYNKTISSKLLAIPVMAVLLTLTIGTFAPEADAVMCDDPHCYSIVKKDKDNRGGSVTIDINSGNSVESSEAIVNSLWIIFDNGEWMEAGWQKGTNMNPCLNSSAKFFWYETVGSQDDECIGSVSGSTMTAAITDANLNDSYILYVNGNYETSVVNTDDALEMHVGGESTHEDNVLDNGQDQNLTIIYPSGTAYWWGSNNLSYDDDKDYTNGWNTQYTDFHYEGP